MKRLLVLLAACTQDDPCAGVAGTCVTLHVTSPSVTRVDALQVDLLAGAFHATSTTAGGALPAETALELALAGDLDLGIVAGDAHAIGATRLAVADGAHVAATVELVEPMPCTANLTYCGGDLVAGSSDTLYRCEGGFPIARGVCAGGCLTRPASKGDACNGVGGACVDGGLYCGGDKLDGDPQSLYRCSSGVGALVMACANGCAVGSAGHDDACR